MNELLELLGPELTPIIYNLLLTLIGVLSTYLGIQVKKLMSRVERSKETQEIREKLKANEELVKTTVEYVEKIGGHLASEEKRNLAIDKSVEIANQKGLDITRTEVEVLIEGILLKFEEGYNSESDIHMEQNVIEAPEGEYEYANPKEVDENDVIVYPEKEEDNK